jgi:hypothetical protein
METKVLLAHASKKYGVRFNSVEDALAHIESLEEPCGEVSEATSFRLRVDAGMPMNYEEIAMCSDKRLEAIQEQMRIRLMTHTMPRNSLYVRQPRASCTIEKYVDGKLVERVTHRS